VLKLKPSIETVMKPQMILVAGDFLLKNKERERVMETKAIFKASLKLIKQGKFHSTSMAEIAYNANLAGSTVLIFFENREKLISALGQTIFTEIENIIKESDQPGDSSESRFFALWENLFKYYVLQPEVIAFVEQFDNRDVFLPETGKTHSRVHELLFRFFSDANSEQQLQIKPSMLAVLFHENVRLAAKLSIHDDQQARHIARLLWNGIALRRVK
jgi:AcrR family transcriptional regulator